MCSCRPSIHELDTHHDVFEFFRGRNINVTTVKVIVLLLTLASMQRLYSPRWLQFNLNLVAHKILCTTIQTNLKQKL